MSVTAGDIAAFSRRLGFQGLKAGLLGDGLRRILNPIDYWRCLEIPAVLEDLRPRAGQKILDVGSPKIAALYLAASREIELAAVDISERTLSRYRRILGILEESGRIAGHCAFEVEDGRRLGYGDETFESAFSISVLEHIPGKGDVETVREMARVLRPGGRLVLTLPVAAEAGEIFLNRDLYGSGKERTTKGYFFQRYYDAEAIAQRIVVPSGLRVVRLRLFTERFVPFERIWTAMPRVMRLPLHPLQPLMAHAFLRESGRSSFLGAKAACIALLKP